MKYRRIVGTDLEVSVVALGTWVFGGEVWGEVEVEDGQSVRVVETAIDRGINIIDTAPIYGDGRSEEVIGKALKDKRDKVIIATKCGLEKRGHSIRSNLRAKFIRQEIENSLKRLDVDMIDLYQCHWPDPNTSLKETLGELESLIKEGKIRYAGVSNFDRKTLEQVCKISTVISNQMQYSLFDREIEADVIPFCRDNNMSILTYGSLGGGILTGKYTTPPVFPRGDVRSFFYKYYQEPFWSKARKFVSVLDAIAEKHKVPISDVAINWVLSHKVVASCIVGCRTPEQLEQNVKAADWSLSSEELTEIQEKYERVM